MSQLVNDNTGEEDSYTMIRNWFNSSDPLGVYNEVPSFVTALTFPPIPEDLSFKCSSLSANAEDLVRASELVNIEQSTDGSDEYKRLNSLIGKNNYSQMTKNHNLNILILF